jgi:exosortase/archaeosortase family protein
MRSPEATHRSAGRCSDVVARTGAPDTAAALPGRALLLRAALFLLVFSVLQVAWELSRGGALEQLVIHDIMVRPAAALIQLLSPAIGAAADGYSIRAAGGGLNIRNGCEGVEAVFLLLAAFASTPMGWRSRLAGMAAGIALVLAANQLRILTLFYAWREDPALFATLHGTVVPVATVLLVGGYYHAWLAHMAPRNVTRA